MGRLQDLKLALILELADKVSLPASRLQKAAQALSDRLKDTRESLRHVNDQARQVAHLQQLNGKLGDTSAKLAEARRESEYFRRMMEIGGKQGAKAFSKDLERTNAKIAKLSATERKLTAETRAVDAQLRAAGIDTSRLGAAQAQLKQRADQLTATLGKQEKQLKKLKQLPQALAARWDALKSSMQRFVMVGSVVAGTALGVGTAVGIPALNKASEFEGYESVLKVIEGSRAKAQASMKWVEDFATKTPYELSEVTDAFVRLRSYGLDPTNGLMKTLGDTSAAMNKPIMQAVEAIADAVTGENERLKEFGIKARADGDLFRYEFTDKKGVQRELAALKTDRKSIEAVLRKIWSERFDGAMEEKSKTWTGIMSNLGDMWSKFQRMVMASGPFEKLKAQAQGLLNRLDAMAASGQLQAWADKFGTAIVNVIDGLAVVVPRVLEFAQGVGAFAAKISAFLGGWDNLAIAFAGGQLVMGLAQVLLGFNNVAGVLGGLMTVARAHPLVALISLLAAGALWVIANWDTVRGWATEFWAWLTAKFSAGWEAITAVFMKWHPLGILIKNWDAVTAFFGSLPQRFADAGRNIIDGLRQGIDERWSAIKARIMELGNMLPDWLKEKLGIHSPSRVFAELGGNISEGVGVGIAQRADSALAALRRLGNRLPAALPTALAVGLTAGTAAASPVPGALPTIAGGAKHAVHATPTISPQQIAGVATTVVHATIHVHAAPGMDEQALAREVARQLDQLQRQADARSRSRLYDED